MFFAYANFQRSQKRHCYQLYWDILFPEMFLKSFNKLADREYISETENKQSQTWDWNR